eukprot:scaffold10.g2343.t1
MRTRAVAEADRLAGAAAANGNGAALDASYVEADVLRELRYRLAAGKVGGEAELYESTAWSVHNRLVDAFEKTQEHWKQQDPKHVYYLSAEFLMGRTLTNAVHNLGLDSQYGEALRDLGSSLEGVAGQEVDAALGNGGLGRLAACFLDSIASLDLPGWGYGIRYRYGMFKQALKDGYQVELPDYWLDKGNPWEIRRPEVRFRVGFYGSVGGGGKWAPGEEVIAEAYDVPIPGYATKTCSNLRLWNALPTREFDLDAFNAGDYEKVRQCVNDVVMPEALEKWPVAVLAKLLPRHMAIVEEINNRWLAGVAPHVAAKVAAELAARPPPPPKPAREEAAAASGKDSPAAAEEKEEEEEEVEEADPVAEALKAYSIIQENQWQRGEMLVNMAYLAVVGSSVVNGVAAIHSEIIKTDIFPQFVELFPERFQNKTNGVTLRRWLAYCNPELSALITETLGTDAWIKDADLLAGLKPHAEDAAFRVRWREIKQQKKAALAAHVKEARGWWCARGWVTGYSVTTDALYDIQVKRIHEYKRQFLNAISLIWRYHSIKQLSPEERKKVVPRVVLLGGKAASAYYMAKKARGRQLGGGDSMRSVPPAAKRRPARAPIIVHLINAIGKVINSDPEVVFLPNYNVSEAEASGTSNMKFALNGSLIIGTMDGANIEIGENTGFENLFIFGVAAEEITRLRAERKDFTDYDPRWTKALQLVKGGAFGDAEYFDDLVASVNDMARGNDWFLLANDFATYMDAQDKVDELYRDQEEWTRRSILYTASNGFFSSDRTIRQYADEIWGVKPCPQP